MPENQTAHRPEVEVPPVPEDAQFAKDHWRRMVTGVRTDGTERCIEGPWLSPGDVVQLPAGALMMVVDKEVTGWRDGYHPPNSYRPAKRVPQFEADVALYLVTPDGRLELLWEYHFMRAKSVFGARTCNKISRLLEKYPAPGGEVSVVHEARRPNIYPGTCRWCGKDIRARDGHLSGRGENVTVEHYQKCPGAVAVAGTRCALCGVGVIAEQARQYLIREESGHWETRHLPLVRCDEKTPQSWEEHQQELQEKQRAEQEERRRQAAAQQRREAKNAARRKKEQDKRAAKAREEQRLHEEHLARIAGLATVSRVSERLMDKGLDPLGTRVRLMEHADTLEEGGLTTRWSVEIYSTGTGEGEIEVEEFTWREEAREAYRDLKYSPEPYRPSSHAGHATGGDDCPGLEVPHCDHCGKLLGGSGMAASTGTACDIDCYDAMADARGDHARRWHT